MIFNLPPEQRLNPYPLYAMMRETQPLLFLEPFNTWVLFRYDDVRTALTDHALFSNAYSSARAGDDWKPSLITTDPPRHTALRGLISRAFTPGRVAQMEPRIREIANQLIDAKIASGQMDVMEDLAVPLPVTVIAEMLGIPPEDRVAFKHWSDEIVASADAVVNGGSTHQGNEAMEEMRAYFAGIIAERRVTPREDMVSALLAAEVDGVKLTEADLFSFCWLLLVAGNETTTNLIGNAVLTLLEHTDVLAEVRSDPGLLPGVVEEVLRYRSPVQAVFRLAKQDVEMGGQTIRKGQMVVTSLGSANRDAARFAEPDRFDIRREPNPHLSFGNGIHFCLGAPLARQEGRVALSVLLERLKGLARSGDEPLEPARGFIILGMKHLPVRFDM